MAVLGARTVLHRSGQSYTEHEGNGQNGEIMHCGYGFVFVHWSVVCYVLTFP